MFYRVYLEFLLISQMSLIFCSNVGKIKCKAWQTNLQHCNNTERDGFSVYYSARRTYKMWVYCLPKLILSFRTTLIFCTRHLCTRNDVPQQESPGALTGRGILVPAHTCPLSVRAELCGRGSWGESAWQVLPDALAKTPRCRLVRGWHLLQVISFCQRGNGERRRNELLSPHG